MARIQKYKPNIQKLQTGIQPAVGGPMGSEFAYQGFAELMNTSNEALKKGLDSINLAKDNLWYSKNVSEFDSFMTQYLEEEKTNWPSADLDGYKNKVNTTAEDKINKLLENAPSQKGYDRLNQQLNLIKSGYVNKAFAHETKAQTSQLKVKETEYINQQYVNLKKGNALNPQILAATKTDIHSRIGNTAGLYRTPEEVTQKLEEVNNEIMKTLYYAVVNDKENQGSYNVHMEVQKYLEQNKPLMLELLNGDETAYEDIMSNVEGSFDQMLKTKIKNDEDALIEEDKDDGGFYQSIKETAKENNYDLKKLEPIFKETIALSKKKYSDTRHQAHLKYINEVVVKDTIDSISNPHAIEYIRNGYLGNDDIRQELEIAYLNGDINIHDFEYWREKYTWKDPGSKILKSYKEESDLVDIKLNEFKRIDNSFDAADVQNFTILFRDLEEKKRSEWQGKPGALTEAFNKMAEEKFGINSSIINIVGQSHRLRPHTLLTNSYTDALIDDTGNIINQGLATMFFAAKKNNEILDIEGPKYIELIKVWKEKRITNGQPAQQFPFDNDLIRKKMKEMEQGDFQINDIITHKYSGIEGLGDNRTRYEKRLDNLQPVFEQLLDRAETIKDHLRINPDHIPDVNDLIDQEIKELIPLIKKLTQVEGGYSPASELEDLFKGTISEAKLKGYLQTLIFKDKFDMYSDKPPSLREDYGDFSFFDDMTKFGGINVGPHFRHAVGNDEPTIPDAKIYNDQHEGGIRLKIEDIPERGKNK